MPSTPDVPFIPGNIGASLSLLPEFQRVLNNLQPTGDGRFRSRAEADYNGNLVSCELELKPARQQ